jgi:YD repeat-containing protein
LGRCYNSFDTSDPTRHAFGPGWASVCEAGLSLDNGAVSGMHPDGLARLTLPDGRQILFPRLGEGWDRAVGESLWLAADPDSTDLLATGNDGSWWRLSSSGLLRSFGTGPLESRGHVEVTRDDEGRVARLMHARGQWIELDWADGHVAAARTADGRTVEYAYDGDGQLLSASGPAGTRSYGWVEGLITTVTDADGVVEAENVYDAERRVTSQRSQFGRVTRFVYLPGRVTVVSDEDGTRSNTWIADDKGRLVGVVDADEQRQSTSYDRWGNPVVLTERDGATTVHEYDARGRRVRTVTPSGADVTYGYDDLDRVTTVVTEQGAVTEYAYVGEQRNPSTILDPEGGLTHLTWTDGLLTEVADPTDVRVRFSHDDRGDLVGTTNADGHTARLERDSLGRVTAAVTPSGHTTRFRWDPSTGQPAASRA